MKKTSDPTPGRGRFTVAKKKDGSSSRGNNKEVVPAAGKQASKQVFDVDADGNIIPGEYKTQGGTLRVKKIEPAKHYDVISVARAMNEDFGSKVKTLFDPESEAALKAIKTGLYLCWRPIDPPYNKQDCQRINQTSRCFCDHMLQAHDTFTGKEQVLKCLEAGCLCKAFKWIPSRPEEVGEYWLRKRRDFDANKYRIRCRCKHLTSDHKTHPAPHKCLVAGCGCSFFYSASVCAACDQHWQVHETVLETAKSRKQDGRPVGEDWLPFAELPDMCHMALTGEDRQFETLWDALPDHLRKGPRPEHPFPSGPSDPFIPGRAQKTLPAPEFKPDYTRARK